MTDRRPSPPRRLRILCLHGFRQTGDVFKGRTRQLRRDLQDVCEFGFIDAPHQLPLYFKAPAPGTADSAAACAGAGASGAAGAVAPAEAALPPPFPKRAWLVEPAAPPPTTRHAPASQPSLAAQPCTTGAWALAPEACGAGQFLRQTDGWEASLGAVQCALSEDGPWDGLLGFSQGAAVAAHLAAMRQHEPRDDGSSDRAWLTQLRFVVLISGFVSPCPSHRALLLDRPHGVALPALHVIGGHAGEGSDSFRDAALQLLDCWDPSAAQVLQAPAGGPVIPSTPEGLLVLLAFLRRFMQHR